MSGPPTRPGTAASADPLRRAAGLLWPNLPVLLAASVLVAATWTTVRLLPPTLGWLAVLGLGLVVLPVFAALLHGCTVLLDDEDFGLRDLGPALWRSYVPAVRVSAAPTFAVLLTLLAAQLWRTSHQSWMLVSLGTGTAVSLATSYIGVVVLPYLLRTGVPFAEAWLVSCYIAVRHPVPVLAVLSAVAIGVWASTYLSFALVLLLPAPLALVWAAGAATATGSSRARLPDRRPSLR